MERGRGDPLQGRDCGSMLEASNPLIHFCNNSHLLQVGVHLLSSLCAHSPHLLQVYTCHSPSGGLQDPHLSQKVCRQGRTLGHRYRSRQMLHTRNCLSIGWTSGPGLSSLFAMATTDGSATHTACVWRDGQHQGSQHLLSPPILTSQIP